MYVFFGPERNSKSGGSYGRIMKARGAIPLIPGMLNYLKLRHAGATRSCGVLRAGNMLTFNIQRSTYSTSVGTSTSTTRTFLFNHIKLADSHFPLFNKD